MRTNSALSDGDSGQDVGNRSSCYDGGFMSSDIQSKVWYWGNSGKEVLALAMQNEPTGTFAVRDASTPGDYTLTVRINTANKLVRIYVKDGRAGFTPEELDYDSVVDLVEYYRNRSLEEHNPTLKTSLKFPLSRFRQVEPPTSDLKASGALVAAARVPRNSICTTTETEPDVVKSSTDLVLDHFIDSVVVEMLRAERRHKQIQAQSEMLRQEYESHKKANLGCENIIKLLTSSLELLSQSMAEANNDKATQQTVSNNKTLQETRIKNVKDMKTRLKLGRESIKNTKRDLEHEDTLMLKRANTTRERIERYIVQLGRYGVDHAFIEAKTNYLLSIIKNEPQKLTQNLLRINLITSPFDWLTKNTDKEYSNNLVRRTLLLLKKRGVTNTDGVFIIRPSTSRANCYAMVISMHEEIFNCLIEYRPSHLKSTSSGYAFLNTDLFYTTLCDFIRYYSLVTLYEHNEHLNTTLRIPVLKYLSGARKRQHLSTKPIDAEESEIISNLDIDHADCMTPEDETDLNFEASLNTPEKQPYELTNSTSQTGNTSE